MNGSDQIGRGLERSCGNEREIKRTREIRVKQ